MSSGPFGTSGSSRSPVTSRKSSIPGSTFPSAYNVSPRLIGKRIAQARRRINISQTKLGRLTGLTRGSIANIELGRQHAPLHTIWQLASKLEIDPRMLLPDPQELRIENTGSPPAKAPSARVARVAGASLPRVSQFIEAKKEEVTNGQTSDSPNRDRATNLRTSEKVRSHSTSG
ncbi:MAG: helix-turn-helix domain-containing protein [Candidatus Binataceae bacterium]